MDPFGSFLPLYKPKWRGHLEWRGHLDTVWNHFKDDCMVLLFFIFFLKWGAILFIFILVFFRFFKLCVLIVVISFPLFVVLMHASVYMRTAIVTCNGLNTLSTIAKNATRKSIVTFQYRESSCRYYISSLGSVFK